MLTYSFQPKADKTVSVEALPGARIDEAAKAAGLLRDQHVAAVVDGTTVDLFAPLPAAAATVRLVTVEDEEGLHVMRHSTAHLMAQAIKRLYPDAQVTIGPVVDNGFYYDIAYSRPFSPEDLSAIEVEMEKARSEKHPIVREVVSALEAKKYFAGIAEHYKCQIIDDIINEPTVSLYRQGDFTDLCRGPHLPSTGHVGAFKLMSVAGAYWRGNEKNAMLQRIYGTAWQDRKRLQVYLNRLEEAKKRDHRKLGKDLELFFMHEISPASPFFLPRGTALYNALVDYIRTLYIKYGYQEVVTPQVFDVQLWKTSGHWDHYRDNMFLARAGQNDKAQDKAEAAEAHNHSHDHEAEREFGVKPMNCPGHTIIYSSALRSYRDLPLRIADFGRLHRYERSGVTSGLTRVRSFCQDDAHIFCTPEQIGDEIRSVLAMIDEVYKAFGFERPQTVLSTRPESFMGDINVWNQAEDNLRSVLRDSPFGLRENPGDGAFYGPKIDFKVQDAIGREWQLATIQLDFQLPERFGLEYVAADNSRARPVMIHRAVLGSVERFFGIIIEHFAGAFPFWLAPEQIRLIPVGEAHVAYAQQIQALLREQGYRVELDASGEHLKQKIKTAQLLKIPYMAILGDNEVQASTISLRQRDGQQHNGLSQDNALQMLAGQFNPRRA